MAGIKDVAKAAGVGVGTVSRVINDSGYVAEETREKVKKAMEELNYTPNELARNLYHKKTGIIAVLVPDISHPFFSQFVKCVEMELYDRGYKTMIGDTSKENNCESEYLQLLKRQVVDGVITGVHTLKIEEYLSIDRPIIALDRYIGENIPVVSVNHKTGGYLAAEELLRARCKNVIQFVGARTVTSPSLQRHDELERVLSEAGVAVYTYELEWNRFDTLYFEEAVQEVYEKHPNADGVFGADLLALEYMKTALLKGKRVPEDLKVICYDGTFITDIVTPSVTVIQQPIGLLANKCVSLMMECISGKKFQKKVITLEPELIVRDSTAAQR